MIVIPALEDAGFFGGVLRFEGWFHISAALGAYNDRYCAGIMEDLGGRFKMQCVSG